MIIIRAFYALVGMVAIAGAILLISWIIQLCCHFFIAGTSIGITNPNTERLALTTVAFVTIGAIAMAILENRSTLGTFFVGLLAGAIISGPQVSPLDIFHGTAVATGLAQAIYIIATVLMTLACYLLGQNELNYVLGERKENDPVRA